VWAVDTTASISSDPPHQTISPSIEPALGAVAAIGCAAGGLLALSVNDPEQPASVSTRAMGRKSIKAICRVRLRSAMGRLPPVRFQRPLWCRGMAAKGGKRTFQGARRAPGIYEVSQPAAGSTLQPCPDTTSIYETKRRVWTRRAEICLTLLLLVAPLSKMLVRSCVRTCEGGTCISAIGSRHVTKQAQCAPSTLATSWKSMMAAGNEHSRFTVWATRTLGMAPESSGKLRTDPNQESWHAPSGSKALARH
jgi:hypothetical protein